MSSWRIWRYKVLVKKGKNGLRYELMLALLLGTAVLSLSRGYENTIRYGTEPYWFINYSNGLIRRGLLGQIFSFFQDQGDVNEVLSAALYVHLAACMLLL